MYSNNKRGRIGPSYYLSKLPVTKVGHEQYNDHIHNLGGCEIMPYFTTGLLDNSSAEGAGRSSALSVNILNDDTSTVAIQIEGFLQNKTTKVKYVEEFFTLTAGTVALRNYFIPSDSYEFVFFVSSSSVEISVWIKDDTGILNPVPLIATETSA